MYCTELLMFLAAMLVLIWLPARWNNPEIAPTPPLSEREREREGERTEREDRPRCVPRIKVGRERERGAARRAAFAPSAQPRVQIDISRPATAAAADSLNEKASASERTVVIAHSYSAFWRVLLFGPSSGQEQHGNGKHLSPTEIH